MPFVHLASPPSRPPPKKTQKRVLSTANIVRFKEALGRVGWGEVIECNDTDESYNIFWDKFNSLFEVCIPMKGTKGSKNTTKRNCFMTQGLLNSRKTKLLLHKTCILDPSPANILKYKSYRNLYNRVLRQARRNFYVDGLKKATKNPKKSWEILKEALNMPNSNKPVEKITVNGESITDPKLIASHFNDFFADAGQEISNSTHPTAKDPSSYLNPNNAPNLTSSKQVPMQY